VAIFCGQFGQFLEYLGEAHAAELTKPIAKINARPS
jgi:hypothetical protein